MALPIRYADFPHPGQSTTIRLLAEEAGGAFLLSGREGGQVGYGSPLSAEDLELHSNPSENGDLILGILVIDEANGRVGIATATPSTLLELVRTQDSEVLIRSTNANSRASVRLANDAQEWRVRIRGDDFLSFDDVTAAKSPIQVAPGAGTQSLIIDASGIAFLGAAAFAGGVGVFRLGNLTTEPGTPGNGVFFGAKDVASRSEFFVYNEEGQRVRVTGRATATTSTFAKTDATLALITGLTRNVEAGKRYKFVARLWTTLDTTGGEQFSVGGTCTATSVVYEVVSISETLPTVPVPIRQRRTALGSSSGSVGSGSTFVTITGLITVNTAGTLGPMFAQSSASGTSQVDAGIFEIEEIT